MKANDITEYSERLYGHLQSARFPFFNHNYTDRERPGAFAIRHDETACPRF